MERVRAIAKAIAEQWFAHIGDQNPELDSQDGEIAREYLLSCVDSAALLAKTDLVLSLIHI